jgi:enoyl-CoA hydratase
MGIPTDKLPRIVAMTSKTVLVETADRICRITINRPDKLNALNRGMLAELGQAFESAKADDDVRVVVLTGAGTKAFIAGADIGEIQQLDSADDAIALSATGQDLTLKIQYLGKPVIAAVNGYALGGGCEMALACTLRVASSNALLGLPEIKLGILPGYGGTQRLARLTGRGLAMEMALTGEPIPAQRAFELGLVNSVVEPEELAATVDKLAGRLAQSAPQAMRCIMEAINLGPEQSLEAGLELERTKFGEVAATQDMIEGTTAFLEKRQPHFTGD